MSKRNKVNPGMYTQRGRLTQDDAARELRKQGATAPPHSWPPANTGTRTRLVSAGAAPDTKGSADTETRGAAAPSNAVAKASKAKARRTRRSTATTGKATTGKAKTTTARKRTTKPTRPAVLARNVGGGGAAPRRTTKRRKG